MEIFWWTMFILGITFYTLWVAGAFGKKKNEKNNPT